MGSDAKKVWNAQGRGELLMFAPEDLTLVTDKIHPLYDERVHLPLVESTVLNIMVNGVIEPISVRKNGEKNGKPVVEVIVGRQRVKHAIEANKRLVKEGKPPIRVPGIVKRGEDADLFGVMVSENEFRQNDNSMVRARKLQRYLNFGRSEAEAAIQFGVTTFTIKNLLLLLDCHADVQKAVEHEKIGATLAAKEISKAPREEQPAILAKLLESGVKGEGAKESVQRLRKNGNGEHVKSQPRLRSRKEINKAIKTLLKTERKDAEVAVAALKFVLGSDSSFNPFPPLEKALYPEEE